MVDSKAVETAQELDSSRRWMLAGRWRGFPAPKRGVGDHSGLQLGSGPLLLEFARVILLSKDIHMVVKPQGSVHDLGGGDKERK